MSSPPVELISLEIASLNNPVFVPWNRQDSDSALPSASSSASAEVRGTVLLRLLRDANIRSLQAVLRSTLKLPGDKELKLDKEERLVMELRRDLVASDGDFSLPVGTHSLDFTFQIPSHTEIAQHSLNGYMEHLSEAILELAPEGSTDAAIATTTIKSCSRPVCLIALPDEPGDLREPFSLSLEHHSQFLGPVKMDLLAPHLTLAALAHLRLHILDPPQPVSILSIRASITQTMNIRYTASTKPVEIVESVNLLSIDDTKSNPKLREGKDGLIERRTELKKGESRTFQDLIKMPSCDQRVATSTFGRDGTIGVRHVLVVEIRYGAKGYPKEKFVTIKQPVTIASCVCLTDSILLPPYTQAAPRTVVKDITGRSLGWVLCLCDYSLEEVVKVWGKRLKELPSQMEDTSRGLERTVSVKEGRVDSDRDSRSSGSSM